MPLIALKSKKPFCQVFLLENCPSLTWMNQPGEIDGRHVPGDELVGDAEDATEVKRQLEEELHKHLKPNKVLQRIWRRGLVG